MYVTMLSFCFPPSFLLTWNNDRWLCLIQRFTDEAIQGNRSGNLMPKSALKIELTFRKILQVSGLYPSRYSVKHWQHDWANLSICRKGKLESNTVPN